MGRVSEKRGLVRFFLGRKGDMQNETYNAIFQIILAIFIVAALFAYRHSVITDTGFEKRVASIDIGLVTTSVFYAPGTLKFDYRPYAFKDPVQAAFGNSTVAIVDTNDNAAPVVYWHLSDFSMDMLRESGVWLKGMPVEGSDDYNSTVMTYYKAGRQVAFSGEDTHPLQIVCPTVNTSVIDWQSQKVFMARVFQSAESYKDETLPANRIVGILNARHSDRFLVSGGQQSSGKSAAGQSPAGQSLSGIPKEANLVIALGESGDRNDTGGLVVYIPDTPNMLRARKLACMLVNNLLVPESVVYYAQIMPVFVESVSAGSPLQVFKEISDPSQVAVFVDISGFKAEEVDVDAFSDAVINAVKKYYGEYEVGMLSGVPLNFFSLPTAGAVAAESAGLGAVAGGAADMPLPGVPAANLQSSGDTPVSRMLSVCGGPETWENMKAVTKFWVEQSMADGAVYVRGGKTDKNGACSNYANVDFLINRMKQVPPEAVPASCAANERSKQCIEEMRVVYQKYFVDPISGKYFCGDCASYIHQMYQCGLGRGNPRTAPVVGATPGAIKSYSESGDVEVDDAVWNVPGDNCWDSVVVPQMGGRLEFGDIIVMTGHYVMYTGDAGLGYEIVEMGRGAMQGHFTTAKITATGPDGKAKMGLRLTENAEEMLRKLRTGCIIRRVDAPQQWLKP